MRFRLKMVMFLHLGPSKGMYDSPPPPQGLPKKAIILHLSLARERLTLLLLLLLVVCPIMATILRLGLAGERPNLLPLLMVCLIMATILHLGLAREHSTLLPFLMVYAIGHYPPSRPSKGMFDPPPPPHGLPNNGHYPPSGPSKGMSDPPPPPHSFIPIRD